MNEKTITQRHKEKEKLSREADKVIEKIKKLLTIYRVDHLAAVMGIRQESLSRFVNMEERYVTRSMVDRINAYLKSIE